MHQPTDPRYPGRNPAPGNVDDAWHELDREMRELQQKMDALRNPPQPPAPPAPAPQAPAPQRQAPPAPQAPAPAPSQPVAPQPQPGWVAQQQPAPPAAPAPSPPAQQPQSRQPQPRQPQHRQTDWVDATSADLRRLRDGLNRLAQELNGAVDDLLSGIEVMRARGSQPAHPQQPVPQPPVPQPPVQQQAPVPEPPPELGNVIELDAGPFDDLVSVERFKQAMGDLPGVEDVYVKAYGRGRAVIELTVDDRQTVVDEMHVHLPYSLDAGPAPDGKVIVSLHPAPPVEQAGA